MDKLDSDYESDSDSGDELDSEYENTTIDEKQDTDLIDSVVNETDINEEDVDNSGISPDDIKPVLVEVPDNKPIEPIKKRPGRPKKQIVKKIVPKVGIVKEPSNLKTANDPRLINVFELVYDNPTMFKRIFSLFKSMAVEKILVRFEESVIKMWAKDHPGASDIHVVIFGDKINRYYSSKLLEIGLGPVNVQRILQTLNKDNSKIYWFTNVQYQNSKIKIGLSNDEMEEDSIYSVDIDTPAEYDWDVENELSIEDEYPLKFELPFRYFKKKVTDFILLGEIMKIEKHGLGPLRLSYNFTNKKGDHNTYFRNPAIINLNSSIDQGEIFSTSVYLEHIKPLAGSLIADTIHISACIDQKIIFTAYLDQDESPNKKKIPGTEKCQIKILTKIVKARGEEDNSNS